MGGRATLELSFDVIIDVRESEDEMINGVTGKI